MASNRQKRLLTTALTITSALFLFGTALWLLVTDSSQRVLQPTTKHVFGIVIAMSVAFLSSYLTGKALLAADIRAPSWLQVKIYGSKGPAFFFGILIFFAVITLWETKAPVEIRANASWSELTKLLQQLRSQLETTAQDLPKDFDQQTIDIYNTRLDRIIESIHQFKTDHSLPERESTLASEFAETMKKMYLPHPETGPIVSMKADKRYDEELTAENPGSLEVTPEAAIRFTWPTDLFPKDNILALQMKNLTTGNFVNLATGIPNTGSFDWPAAEREWVKTGMYELHVNNCLSANSDPCNTYQLLTFGISTGEKE